MNIKNIHPFIRFVPNSGKIPNTLWVTDNKGIQMEQIHFCLYSMQAIYINCRIQSVPLYLFTITEWRNNKYIFKDEFNMNNVA